MYKFSVAICTYNRAEMLRQALISVCSVDYPLDALEIMVIDNNSTDHTQEVVEEICKSAECLIRYVHEPNQGISAARNRALSEFRGEYLLFTDDDVLVEPNWITEMEKTFTRSGALCVGGRVFLQWNFPKPEWLHPKLEYALSFVDFGEQDIELVPPHAAVTANAGFHRSVFERYGRFNEELGAKKEDFMRGEDTEFVRRIQREPGKVYYSARAVVHHVVLPERATKEWFLKRFRRAGETNGKWRSYDFKHVMKLKVKVQAGRMLSLWGKLVKNAQLEFYAQCKTAMFNAELKELLSRRFQTKQKN